MAKYTELFADWLKDNDLPEIFSTIDGFADLFKLTYAAREIGFETPTLFNMRLTGVANKVIPLYVTRFAAIDAAETAKAEKQRSRTFTGGERSANETVLPVNTQSGINPTSKSESETYTDTDELTETGYTPDELIREKEYVYNKPFNLMSDLLKEFEHLFMQVF